jgi:16S rRNA (guanine(966)-N(2))-methyltransferase RsmD
VKRFLKLTGGSFMGRRLYVPDMGVRPATNLVREAIFSTLNSFFENGVQGLEVLDLFAGTGSLGLEAISRGAAAVTFVDQSSESVRSIRRNLEILEYEGQVIKAMRSSSSVVTGVFSSTSSLLIHPTDTKKPLQWSGSCRERS